MSKKNKDKLKMHWTDPLNPLKYIKPIKQTVQHELQKKKFRDERQDIINNPKSTTQEKQTAKAQLLRQKRGSKTVAEVQAKAKSDMKSRAEKKHADWKRMKKGDMSKEAFIKKYPNSQTAKKAKTSKRKPKSKKDFGKKLLITFRELL